MVEDDHILYETRLRIPQEFPRNSLGIPFFGFSDLGNGVPF